MKREYTDWEVGREYDTRDGLKARVLATDGPEDTPIVVMHLEPNHYAVRLHRNNGHFGFVPNDYDLRPPRRTLKVWWVKKPDGEELVCRHDPASWCPAWPLIPGPNEDGSFTLEASCEEDES